MKYQNKSSWIYSDIHSELKEIKEKKKASYKEYGKKWENMTLAKLWKSNQRMTKPLGKRWTNSGQDIYLVPE